MNNIIKYIIVVIIVILFGLGFSTNITKKYIIDNKNDSQILATSDDIKEGYEVKKTETSNYITYDVIDYERNLTYSWDFIKDSRKSIKENINMDINLRLNLDKIVSDDTKDINERVKQNKLIISFDYHGELPLNAKVRINVKDKFRDNEKLYLYYYEPEDKDFLFVDNNIVVKDGYVEFMIEHCSDYFLTGAVVNEAINNPKSLNYIIIGLGVFVIILIAVNLIQSKK